MNNSVITWVPLAMYTLAALPQFITSLRTKSAKGVSQGMIYIRLTAVSFYVIYAFSCGLPLAYRVLMPVYWVMLGSLGLQGYLYDSDHTHQRMMRLGYGFSALCATVMIMVARFDPYDAGMVSGWIALCGYAVCEIPQVYKNYRRRSLKGFNFFFPSFLALGAVIELIAGLVLGYPKPTLASSVRILTFYAIYCAQYLRFHVLG